MRGTDNFITNNLNPFLLYNNQLSFVIPRKLTFGKQLAHQQKK